MSTSLENNGRKRLHVVAKELNLEASEVLKILDDLKIPNKNALSYLTEVEVEQVHDYLGSQESLEVAKTSLEFSDRAFGISKDADGNYRVVTYFVHPVTLETRIKDVQNTKRKNNAVAFDELQRKILRETKL